MSVLLDKPYVYLSQVPKSTELYLNDAEMIILNDAIKAHALCFGFFKQETNIIRIGMCLVEIKFAEDFRDPVGLSCFNVLSKIITVTIYKMRKIEMEHYIKLEQESGSDYASKFLQDITERRAHDLMTWDHPKIIDSDDEEPAY